MSRWVDGAVKLLKELFWRPKLIGVAVASFTAVAAVWRWFDEESWEACLKSIKEFLPIWWPHLMAGLFLLLSLYLFLLLLKSSMPRLEILYEDTDYYKRQEYLSNTPWQTVLIKLNYWGIKAVEDCSVRLEDIIDESGKRPFTDLPAALQRTDGNGIFPLRHDSPKPARVAALHRGIPESRIYLMLTANKLDGYQERYVEIPRGRYTIEIGLFPKEGVPVRQKYTLYIDDQNILSLASIN